MLIAQQNKHEFIYSQSWEKDSSSALTLRYIHKW